MHSRRAFIGGAAAVPFLQWPLRAQESYPQAALSNGHLKLSVYLPDREKGYYRATRFDWSGVIASLEYKGHNFYGPWFDERDPSVRDFIHRDGKIIAGPASGITGPVDEFQRPLGFDAAKPGETFIKIGVGALRKPDDMAYSAYRIYEIADGGNWTVKPSKDSIEFRQQLASGAWGYDYRKTVALTNGKPEMMLAHRLTNTGREPITTNVYNHNFLVLDKQAPGPDLQISFPFSITTDRPPDANFAAIDGTKAIYKKRLGNQERVSFPVQGHSALAKDHSFQIDNPKLGVGMRVTGDQPVARIALWSIRSVMAIEPFLDINLAPGQTFEWTTRYEFHEVR